MSKLAPVAVVQRPLPSTATISLPMEIVRDVGWQSATQCFEFQCDNLTLASWMCGDFICKDAGTLARLSKLSTMVAGCIGFCGWQCRHIADNWIRWVPRASNTLADKLANMSIGTKGNIGWQSDRYPACMGNVVVTTDGGYRPSSGASSAGWAVFVCRYESSCPLLIACGGALLEEDSSDKAELAALELGFTCFLNFVGRSDILNPLPYNALTETQLSVLAECKDFAI